MEKKATFVYERDTKRTYRFQEEGNAPIIGTLYVQKHVFDSRPNRIEVTIKDIK